MLISDWSSDVCSSDLERGWGACVTVKRRLVVGVTGATGAIYAVRMLQVLRAVPDVETHLVVSPPGVLNIKYELKQTRQHINARSEERRVGKECVSKCRSGGAPYH